MDTVTAPAQASYEVAVQRNMLEMAQKSGDLIAALQEIEVLLASNMPDDALVVTVATLDRWNPKAGA